tara:strand:- start:47 stop:850 length:804 start_codon:yes stop_codon:yes gene_type:complete
MTSLKITPKKKFQYKIDMSFLNDFKEKSIEQIRKYKISYGSKYYNVSDLFSVIGKDPSTIIINNASIMMDNIGKKLHNTKLIVNGSIGNSAAFEMISGTLIINGNVNANCASGMIGGNLFIYGNTDEKFCSSPNTSREGLIDGNIYISGSIGPNSIKRMRRGLIIVEKNIGDNCCSNLISGTIIAKGMVGKNFLENPKRGTIFTSDKKVIKGYRRANNASYNFLSLMKKSLELIYNKDILKNNSYSRYQGNFNNSTNLTEIFLSTKN